MTSPFSDGSARTLIVDESGSGRQLLSDVVRALRFQDIVVVASGRDALALLEVESFDWLVMPLLSRQPVNALHLLKIISEQPTLKQTRVSLVYEPADVPLLEAAFALGLMSCHQRTYLRDELQKDLQQLLGTLKAKDWRPVLAAAEYLRVQLRERSHFDALVSTEKSLLELYPGSASLLLKMGEAQLLAGDTKGGISTLKQAGLIDERTKGVGQAIAKKITNEHMTSLRDEETPQNVLGIERCILIEPDTAVQSSVRTLLESVGVPKIDAFDDGDAAWRWLETNPEPGLIFQEWRVPGVAGPLLLQRIRQQGYVNVPVVVMSSVVRPGELPLLHEMGVDSVIAKPFGQQLFFKNLVWTLQQNHAPTEQKSLERKIRRLLESGKICEAERLRQIYLRDRRVSTPAKKQIDAEFAYHRGKYRQARDLAIEALKLAGDSLMLLNLIGKCLLKLGDYGAALKFFEKANSLSPLNVEHLCNMAVSHFEMGITEKSDFLVQQAKEIDPGNRMVRELEVQHAIVEGKTDRAKCLMGQLQSVNRVIGYMNNRAVALTKCGRYDDGILLYQQTMKSLPGEWTDTHDIVAYNMGLAFARYGDLVKAQGELKPILCRAMAPLFRKASSLSRRIGLVIENGMSLSLFAHTPDDAEGRVVNDEDSTVSMESLVAALEIHRGDVCLKDIFEIEMSPEVTKLLANGPRFRSRGAVDRPETFQHRPGGGGSGALLHGSL